MQPQDLIGVRTHNGEYVVGHYTDGEFHWYAIGPTVDEGPYAPHSLPEAYRWCAAPDVKITPVDLCAVFGTTIMPSGECEDDNAG